MPEPKIQVYYDGACPVCSAEIAQYRTARGADALAFVDATSCPPEALAGLPRAQALASMHVRLADGTLVQGAAAFAAIWSALPALAWAGRLARLPIIAPGLELGYKLWLRLRR
jgi:predicted DCC family thiol-disulfide oxidoreductase YuxK